jgi:Protein of unknown function VcgC/VcgE (DUF2780)
MADFLTDLASRADLDGDQAHRGVGALLNVLKNRLDPAAFAHVQQAIPDSSQILSRFEESMRSTGGAGALAAVKNAAGKLFGGGEEDPAAAIKSQFANLGLSTEQIRNLLPKLHDMLANKLPPHVLDQIKEHIPGFGSVAEVETQKV